jgi:hypothetical protein
VPCDHVVETKRPRQSLVSVSPLAIVDTLKRRIKRLSSGSSDAGGDDK